MNPARNDMWLSRLPQVGTDIKVHLQDQIRTFPYGRISCDDTAVHINIIEKPQRLSDYPMIAETVQFQLKDVVNISFDNDGQRFSFLGNSAAWLRDLPKSRENSIFMLCKEKDRTIGVDKGWVEFDKNKIYIREILRVTKRGCEIASHERFISEVILVLANNGLKPTLSARTA